MLWSTQIDRRYEINKSISVFISFATVLTERKPASTWLLFIREVKSASEQIQLESIDPDLLIAYFYWILTNNASLVCSAYSIFIETVSLVKAMKTVDSVLCEWFSGETMN